MAHAPLLRTNTAPLFSSTSSAVGGASARTQNTMSVSAATTRSSQMSGSTAFPSTTSLTSLASSATLAASASGQVVATSNIINQKADASRSLYQICVSLRQRLAQVPGFESHLQYLEQLEREDTGGGDPVEALWQMFRTGYPLLTIYNVLQPHDPLVVDDAKANDAKKSKIAVFKFIKACLSDLQIPAPECFVIVDLLGNDTTGFVKVTTVVNHVLDLAKERGLLLHVQPSPDEVDAGGPASQLSYRDYIVRELVDTERKYVQDLENLHDLKKTLEQRGIINGDVVHQIFLNINSILDVQRRFLIRIESTNSVPRHAQQWGAPFVAFEEYFNIYQPFIANQRKAAQLAQNCFDKISSADHPVAVDFNTLDGFLLKPMQRLVKYPLLLKDLLKKSEIDEERLDLEAGIAAAERLLQNANEAVDRDLLDEALEDLIGRVDDWKNHRVDQFGKLLLHGVNTVVTGKSDQEKDYEIYLFECILLCCKELAPSKSKDKKDKTKSAGPKPRTKSTKLQLKGRIFMANVTEILSFSKPGSYTVQIWWRGDPGVENFVIKFQNEESMKKWASGLDTQRKLNAPRSDQSPDRATDFAWMRSPAGGVAALENPYAEDPDDDDDAGPTGVPPPFNGAPLRMRSVTTDSTQSLAGMVRQPPPKFPMPMAPGSLSLQTQLPSQPASSPSLRGGESYFSPVAESPVSSRTSTTSGFFPPGAGYAFPKVGTPQPAWDGEPNRYTAPAMPRAPSRDGPSPSNAYGMANGHNPRGPSMPIMSQNPQTLSQQQRSRSYSTPDINGQPSRRTPGGSQGSIPAVPGIPAHLHPAHERHDSTIPRSNTGSPRNDLPIRTSTQSPGVQNMRLQQQQQQQQQQTGMSYGATMAQFPTQPIYPRQTTPGPTSAPPPSLMPTAGSEFGGAAVSPPLGSAASGFGTSGLMSSDLPVPTQLKVKVNYDTTNYVTLVVAFNVTYQSLIDRIDVKLARFTNSSIGKGNLKLRYRDEDGDFISIESDEDIQIAFMEWRDGVRNMYNGGLGVIELFCVGDTF